MPQSQLDIGSTCSQNKTSPQQGRRNNLQTVWIIFLCFTSVFNNINTDFCLARPSKNTFILDSTQNSYFLIFSLKQISFQKYLFDRQWLIESRRANNVFILDFTQNSYFLLSSLIQISFQKFLFDQSTINIQFII